jgi:hypothetical protein
MKRRRDFTATPNERAALFSATSLWRNLPFQRHFWAHVISLVGSGLSSVALGLLAHQLVELMRLFCSPAPQHPMKAQWHDRSEVHRLLLFARPCGVEPQAAGAAIGGADAAQLGALMVAQSAAKPAGAGLDAAGKPARYENFHFTVHIWVLLISLFLCDS